MLKQIIEKFLCKHSWDLVRKVDVYDTSFCNNPQRPVRTEFLFVCGKCGKFKKLKQ